MLKLMLEMNDGMNKIVIKKSKLLINIREYYRILENKMLLDLIAFVFIVVLAFVLCMNDNNYRCMLSHIILGLSVIVFYKLIKYFNLNKSFNNLNKTIMKDGLVKDNVMKEPFTDAVTNSINDFISGNAAVGSSILSSSQAQSLSASDLASYNDKLSQLINALNDLKTQQSTIPTNVAVSPDSIQKLDLESQQQYQMFQIDYLNKQLQNAKDIINAQTVANTSTNYKPIKVYSSCVISNANGTTSVDVPVNSSTASHSTILPGSSSASTQQMLQTIGQTGTGNSTGVGTSQFLNLSPSTGAFGNLFNNLANGNINVKL
jgi:hypothetical protein